jgi:hypothetical protein
MSRDETAAWLAALQARFGAVLRTPLESSAGTLHADPDSYAANACADIAPSLQLTAAERLSVYHRQYWVRLLKTLQEQYSLLTSLLGAWQFNQYACSFLASEPPRGHDLAAIAEGFLPFLQRELRARDDEPSLPHEALLQAAHIDAEYRRVFYAPPEQPWQLPSADLSSLAACRLQLSAALAVVVEHWPLLELRAAQAGRASEPRWPLPARLPSPRTWLLRRTERGTYQRLLAPLEVHLFASLREHEVGGALQLLAANPELGSQAELAAQVRAFFTDAASHGFFVRAS